MRIIMKLVDWIVLATGRLVLMALDPSVSRRDAKRMDLNEVDAAIQALKQGG